MERVAWVEILARNGEVECRHPVTAWPLRIGRGYDCDVILDDPYVAPLHCVIYDAGAEQFQIEPVSAGNGVQLGGRRLDKMARLTPDDVVRCGHTQLRIRPVDYPVASERSFSRHLTLRDAPTLALALLFLIGVAFADAWSAYTHVDLAKALFAGPVEKCLLALALAIPWALAGRAASGKGNYVAHATATVLLFGTIGALSAVTELLRYAFMAEWPAMAGVVLAVPVIALALYYQSRLALRASARRIAAWCSVVALSMVSVWQINDVLEDRKDMEKLHFIGAVAPPALLIAKGESVDDLLLAADALRASVDGVVRGGWVSR